VSRANRVSSSYSCGQCCPDSFAYGTVTPFETIFGVGQSDLLYVEEVMQNCYGSRYGQPAWPDWSVDQPWIASFTTENWGVARTTGLDPGDATGTASWWSVTYTPVQEDCIENDVQPQLPQQTKVRRVSQSPDRLQMSTGDVGEIVTTVEPSTVNATVSFNNSLSSNPHSDCNVDLVTPGNSGYGTINSPVQATPAGCSGIFNSQASAGGMQSSNSTAVEVPPQILIKMIWGEAEGQSTTSQQGVGFVNEIWPPCDAEMWPLCV